MRFDDFVNATPSTLASHTSLFSGLHPHHHGVASNGWIVPQEVETLAEVLQVAGFHTAGFVGSFALHSRFGVDQGFSHWDQRFDQAIGIDAVDQSQRRADRVIEAVLAYLESSPALEAERLFLFVHVFDTHYPYDPPSQEADAASSIPFVDWTEDERARAQAIEGESSEELARRYAGEAAYIDRQIGRLMDGLRQRGILDDAVLAVVSDHGEALWQHGERWHATEVYQSTVDGIFFARLPGGEAAGPVDGVTGTIDVMPTVLRALRLPMPDVLDGEAFDLQAPRVATRVDRARFSQATSGHVDVAESEEPGAWANLQFPRMVRRGRWKMIQWPTSGREALFDLDEDPGERRDLLQGPTTAEVDSSELRHLLEDWANSADPLPSHFDREFELDTRRQLCALGYVPCPDESEGKKGAPEDPGPIP